ncbi:unnamed protein product [Acanthocheilonema viteae]|uniref:Uncharacterized protein n=1 Tax=Acanthocheilonema viteae TaxID=6277 RepID=A0A498SXX3_ACAVI|nr:unnamed protein product [Acanthocheilonema viteae]
MSSAPIASRQNVLLVPTAEYATFTSVKTWICNWFEKVVMNPEVLLYLLAIPIRIFAYGFISSIILFP